MQQPFDDHATTLKPHVNKSLIVIGTSDLVSTLLLLEYLVCWCRSFGTDDVTHLPTKSEQAPSWRRSKLYAHNSDMFHQSVAASVVNRKRSYQKQAAVFRAHSRSRLVTGFASCIHHWLVLFFAMPLCGFDLPRGSDVKMHRARRAHVHVVHEQQHRTCQR